MNKVPGHYRQNYYANETGLDPCHFNSIIRGNGRTNKFFETYLRPSNLRHRTIRGRVTTRNRTTHTRNRRARLTTIMRYTTTSSLWTIQRNSLFRGVTTRQIRHIHVKDQNIGIRIVPATNTTRHLPGNPDRPHHTIQNHLMTTNLIYHERTTQLFKGTMITRFNGDGTTTLQY